MIIMAETTIGVSHRLKEALVARKVYPRETFEEVIWRLTEK